MKAARGCAAELVLRLGAALVLSLGGCASAPLPHLSSPPATLPDAEVQRRLDFITRRLDASKLHGQIWYASWLAISAGSLAYGAVEAALDSKNGSRADGVGGIVLGGIGIGYITLVPLGARRGADPLRALPDATPEERRQKLERAQVLLQANAERARTATSSWTSHLAGVGLGVIAGAAVWAASGDAPPAILTGATAIAGSEAQFWTEPRQPRRDLEDYVRKFGLGPPATTRRWRLVPAPGGLALRLEF